jgi:hypothetical protein
MTSQNELMIDNKVEGTLNVENSTLTSLNGLIVKNTSKLTINADEDTTFSGNSTLINSNNELTINGGNYNGYSGYWGRVIQLTGGTFNFNGGVINLVNNGYENTAVAVDASNITINMTGGTINSPYHAYRCDSSNDIIHITGGVINGGNRTFYENCILTLDDGEINGTTNVLELKNSTINGGKIRGTNYVISNENAVINGGIIESTGSGSTIYNRYLTINGGTIISSDKAVEVTRKGTRLISGGTIKATNIGVYEDDEGTTTITGGTITAGNYGVRQTKGTVIVGTNDDEVSNATPVIEGGAYGLYKTGGSIIFYDGIFKGKTAGKEGAINTIPEGYTLKEDDTEPIEDSEDVKHLTYLYEMTPFMQVGEHTYNSLNKLFRDETAEDITIEVIDDGNIFTSQSIPAGRKVTLKLNGHTITVTSAIVNYGDLTIEDDLVEVEGEEVYQGTITSTVSTLLSNQSTLTINGGNYTTSGSTIITMINDVTINNGNFNAGSGLILYHGNNSIEGTITLNNGTFKSTGRVIVNDYGKKLTVNMYDGLITGSGRTVEAINQIVFNMYGGEIHGNMYNGILNMSGGKIVGTGSNNVSYSIYGLTINMSGGEIIHEGGGWDGTSPLNNCNLTMTGGKIISDKSGLTRISGLNMSGGEIIARDTALNFDNNVTITITGGLIKSTNSYAIYQTKGTIIVGEDEENGVPNKTTPIIEGNQYGVYKTGGSMRFYDGIFKGKTAGKYGVINTIPEGYILKEDDTEPIEDSEEVNYLTYLVDMLPFLQVGEHTYNSLNKLFAEETDDELTIEVISNGNIFTSQSIPEGKKVTLKLNGHTITVTTPIVNNGELIINENLTEVEGEEVYLGGIVSTSSGLINSTNKLTINGGNYTTSGSTIITMINDVTINNGNFNAGGGFVLYHGNSNTEGTLTVNNGNFKSTGTVFKNDYGKKLTINFNDGLVNGGGRTFDATNQIVLNMAGGEINGYQETIHNGVLNISGGKIIGRGNNYTYHTVTGATITMTGGEIIHETGGWNGTSPVYDCRLTMTGGKIISDKSGVTSIKGLNMSGGEIIAKDQALDFSDNVTINITGGLIKSTDSYGIYQKKGTIVVGESGGDLNIQSPVIIGKTYGIYKTGGTAKIYDGIIKGITSPIEGQINEIEANTYIHTDSETIEENEKEFTYITNYLQPEYEFITNKTQNKNYSNFDSAMSEANDNDKFEMFESINTYNPITIDKNIEIDMKGNNIILVKSITIDTDKEVTIKNTSTEESKISSLLAINLIINNGTLLLDNIKLENTLYDNYLVVNNKSLSLNEVSSNARYGISSAASSTLLVNECDMYAKYLVFNTSGDLTMTGGTYRITPSYLYDSKQLYIASFGSDSTNTITDADFNAGINVGSDSTVNVTNTTVKVRVVNNGTINFTNSDFIDKNGSHGSVIYNSGTFTFDDGNIDIENESQCWECHGSAIRNGSNMSITDSTLKLDNIKLESGLIFQSSTTPLELNNLTITSDNTNVSVVNLMYASSGIINAKKINATITSTNTSSSVSVVGAYVNGGTLNYDESTINVNAKTATGIYVNSGIANVSTSNNIIKASGTTAYGAYVNNNTATLVLGEAEPSPQETGEPNPRYGNENAVVSTSYPYLEGIGTTTGYGLYKQNGYYNFYDGKIVGNTLPRNDTPSKVEKNWEPIDKDDEEYPYSILKYIG